MRKIKDVLRLYFELALAQREIAESVSLGQSTVHDYLRRFHESQLTWPVSLNEQELEAKLFPNSRNSTNPTPANPRHPLPDFAVIDHELRSDKHVTMQLLWEEYRDRNPNGHYSYSRFCHHYDQWQRHQDVTMRQDHVAGEKIFVDWAGAKIPIHNPQTGEIHDASLFVGVLGASSYTYVEASLSEESPHWINAHIRMFNFFGGACLTLVPDNLKTGVIRSCRYDPDLNPLYQKMAEHYGAGIVPARKRKPRDKAKVEVGVQIAQRWIVAALRHQRFHSIHAINEAIGELLVRLNNKPFRKREGSRRSCFEQLDRPALRPLPAERFEIEAWKKATVNIDYHVEFDHCLYSVPYQHVRQSVEIRATTTTVEIYLRGERIASHVRSRKAHSRSTSIEHQPKSHQAHQQWPPSRIIAWAANAGPHTGQLVERILADRPHPEMGYRACLGIIRLGERYSAARLEAACERALLTGAIRYKSIASILKSGLDRQPHALSNSAATTATSHDNIRGSAYYA